MEYSEIFSSLKIRKRIYPQMVLKWHNSVVGYVSEKGSVTFTYPHLNKAVSLITGGASSWDITAYKQFLEERIPSRSRRDIEKILRQYRLVEYDEIDLAIATRALNAKDLFWLAVDEAEDFDDVADQVFSDIFIRRLDVSGDSIVSPEGVNVKRYGVSDNHYGLYKQRLHPYSSDVESEVAVYHLAQLFGVKCCSAWLVKISKETYSFSKFEYDFSKEYIVHARRLLPGKTLTDNEYKNLVSVMPQFKLEIQKMILLDFITRQTDRHSSNFALKVSGDSISFYGLYDNGRSLFYEDKEELIHDAVSDIPLYSSEFGLVGTYYDYVADISQETKIASLINLDVTRQAIYQAISSSGITGHRLEGSVEWVDACLQILKKM